MLPKPKENCYRNKKMDEKQKQHLAQVEKLIPQFVQSAMMIENIPTTIADIQTVMSNAILPNKTMSENVIIRDQILAWREAFRLLKNEDFEISEKIFRYIHKIATREQDYNAGSFRKIDVYISGTSYVPPPPYLIRKNFEDMLLEIGAVKDIDQQSTLLFGEIARNQFFTDGNKRLANLIASCNQINHGRMPFIIDLKEQQSFYQHLTNYYENREHKPLHDFLMQNRVKKHSDIEK